MNKQLTEKELEEARRKFYNSPHPTIAKLTKEEEEMIEENIKIGPVGNPMSLEEALKSIWENE